MNPFEQVAIAWQALSRSSSRLRYLALWIPALVLGSVEWLVLALLCEFARPEVSWAMVPLLHSLGGDALLRYPNLYVALPSIFARADAWIGATVGAVAAGALTLLFAAEFRGEEMLPAAALITALKRSMALVLANLPVRVLLFALGFVVDRWLVSRGSSGMTHKLLGLLLGGGGLLMQSLWFFVTCEIVLAGSGWLGAIRAIPRTAARGFWAALLISSLAALVLLPFDLLSARSAMIVNRGVPELVAMLLAVQIGVGMLRTLLIAGSAALIYLAQVEDREAGRR